MLNHLLVQDDIYDGAKNITISLAIEWIKRSWCEKVTNQTISNGYRKVGFRIDNEVEIMEEEGIFSAEVQEIAAIDEHLELYQEENENWEAGALYAQENVDAEEIEEEDEVEATIPSLREVVGSWNHLKSLIIRRSVPELLALLPDFDHALNEEILQNPSNTIQTSISQYFGTNRS